MKRRSNTPSQSTEDDTPISLLSKTRTRMGLFLLFSALSLSLTYALFVGASIRSSQRPSPPASFDLQKSWAQYSPYFPVEPYNDPPTGCRVDQANVIQRHGARYPTAAASVGIVAAVSKLLAATEFTDPRMSFLTNYTYELGEDDLVPFGAQQSQEAGGLHFRRYSHLVSHDNLPFVRASSSERVVLSATNWTAGFAAASNHVYSPSLSVILSEDLNDTLDDAMCPNAGSSTAQTATWLGTYGPPLAARLNHAAQGANLSAADAFNLLSLCPFESVAANGLSPFCALFTPDDFANFEYSGDLDKYYNTGYGQPLGRVQGVGYINELLARLTHTPVHDATQTNRTLDASPLTFPLARGVYADFTHDNLMVAVYAAMGLFVQRKPLDPTHRGGAVGVGRQGWSAARLVPFSARMVVERVTCGESGDSGVELEGEGAGKGGDGGQKVYVRVLVGDAVQSLEFCGGDGAGLCELDAFVESQAYARSSGAGDFEKCYA